MSEADKPQKKPAKPSMSDPHSAAGEIVAEKEAAPGSLLANYSRNSSGFDELFSADGSIRPHYSKWFGALETFNAAEFSRRSDLTKMLIQEQGITYHVYSDPRGTERPWQLDVIPFVVPPEEWHGWPGFGAADGFGRQILPGEAGADGFYYAALIKR